VIAAPAGGPALRSGKALATATALLVEPVLAAVFPTRCPVCATWLDRPLRGPLCDPCWRSLPRHRSPACGCGLPAPGAMACVRCRRGHAPFAAGASFGPYEGGLRTLVHELKYHGRRRVAARLAEVLLAEEATGQLLVPGSVLVPVPLHPLRRHERGFNQSELLARELARRSGLAVSDALVRRKDTTPQTGLSAAARRRNVAGAFAVRKRAAVAGRVVILVDDVLTTGATAMACGRALHEAGVDEVRLLTVARVV